MWTAIRQRFWVIALTVLVVAGGAVGLSQLQEERYSATASLLFRDPQLDQKLFGSTFLEESSDPAREAATNVSLVSLEEVAARTAEETPGLTTDQVTEQVEVEADGQSDLVSVTATDPDPRLAATLANTFAAQYIDFRRDADRQKIRAAQRLVQAELAELRGRSSSPQQADSLRERLEQLTVLASLQTGNAELVQRAQPPQSPTSPKLVRNSALGVVVGLVLGLALALLLERLDRRLREPDEIADLIDRPVLGAIPASDTIGKGGADVESLPQGEFEAFRMIRANLRYFGVANEMRTILVTSAESGDGKTTVVWNLAAAAASAGARVALLEADLRRPTLSARLGVRPRMGFSHVLAGVAELEDATVRVPIGVAGGGATIRSVDVVFAGAVPPNPTDLLESERMAEILARLGSCYDAVFVDTPPAATVSDAIPLVSRMDGVLVVSRLNQTDRHALRRLAAQLDNLGARTLGVVVNGITRRRDRFAYGYSYGYGYGQRPGQQSAELVGPPGNGAVPNGNGAVPNGNGAVPNGNGTGASGEVASPAKSPARPVRAGVDR